MSLTIGNPYSFTSTGKASTTKIHAFEVDASSDQVEVSPLTRQLTSDQQDNNSTTIAPPSSSSSRPTVGEMPEDTPRSRQITSALSYQAKAILQEKRKGKVSYDKIQRLSTPSWLLNKSNNNKIEIESDPWKETSQKHNLAPMRELFEKIMDRMNQEIWQYERRTILADIQSIMLLVVASLFLYQFAGPTVRWSVFIIRKFSFPVACAYLIVPTLQDKTGASSSEGSALFDTTTKDKSVNNIVSRFWE